ncbi:MAG: response regulator [Candidatus Nealsonbacteria bacterium]
MKKKSKKKILIIEDEKILAEMYHDTFINAGFEVISAVEASEGLVIAKKEKPDLIILDILLPGENGIVFLKKLREESAISSISIVVFTNYDDSATQRKARDLGVKDYLIKANFTPKQFVEKIKRYLK